MELQKLQRISNKKVTKRDQKQKSSKNVIVSLQNKHNFGRLKKTLNYKIQESQITHARLAMDGPCMATYTLVQKRVLGIQNHSIATHIREQKLVNVKTYLLVKICEIRILQTRHIL